MTTCGGRPRFAVLFLRLFRLRFLHRPPSDPRRTGVLMLWLRLFGGNWIPDLDVCMAQNIYREGYTRVTPQE